MKKRLALWSSLILTGLIAYGLGLYQGSAYRIERSVASTPSTTPPESP